MIDIVCGVDYDHQGFDMKIAGHSFFANKGSDIVCAGVSVLIETLVEQLEEVTNDRLITFKDGQIVRIKASGKETKPVFDTIMKGLLLVAYSYPEYVHVLLTTDAKPVSV